MSHERVGQAMITESGRLTSQEIAYFRTFGFLKLPGLFKADVKRLLSGFEEVFATQEPDLVLTDDPLQQTDNSVFQNRRRRIIFHLIDRSENLKWLGSDPRVAGIVTSIIGENYVAHSSDGHIFDCDTSWHRDFGINERDDLFRLKLSFYLDSQRTRSGAIRVIPGSHRQEGSYGQTLLQNLCGNPMRVKTNYGVEPDEIPCWTIESDPGDIICWDYRTIHASFHGFEQRRLFSMTFHEAAA